MEILSVKNLNFSYENDNTFSIRDINITVDAGEMLLLCGPMGCGKSTFMKLLKDEIRPVGSLKGDIQCRFESVHRGYLFQNPESQIVFQCVRDELMFGVQNLGMETAQIKRSLAQITAYLGIEKLLDADTQELSGGQQQLVNLASILMMKPGILLLDEPAASLDPVSTFDFVKLLGKLKEELGIGIIVAEHNLDAFVGSADRIAYMEAGRLQYIGGSDGFVDFIYDNDRDYRESLPQTVKVASLLGKREKNIHYPYSVRELLDMVGEEDIHRIVDTPRKSYPADDILVVKSAFFRYKKNGKDVLNNLSFSLKKGVVYALIGGNGSGKSTLLSVLTGSKKLYRGKISKPQKIGFLPQNPHYCFFQDVLLEDYRMLAEDEKIYEMCERYSFCREIKTFLNRNPLDLSGGQQQKAAIGKMLINDCDICLMDEPVKGMDGVQKKEFGKMIHELAEDGKIVLFVSHDLEFVQEWADICFFMFEGEIIAESGPEEMFADNSLYTTVKGILRGFA